MSARGEVLEIVAPTFDSVLRRTSTQARARIISVTAPRKTLQVGRPKWSLVLSRLASQSEEITKSKLYPGVCAALVDELAKSSLCACLVTAAPTRLGLGVQVPESSGERRPALGLRSL